MRPWGPTGSQCRLNTARASTTPWCDCVVLGKLLFFLFLNEGQCNVIGYDITQLKNLKREPGGGAHL